MGLIVKAFQNTWRLKKLLAALWTTNLFFAGFFLIPYGDAFRNFFSNRLVTHILAKQNIYTYYSEFYHYKGATMGFALSWIQIGNLIYFLLMAFFSGGFISALLKKERITFKTFWRDCLRFGLRMIVLGLFTPVILGLLFLVGLFAGLPFSLLLPEVSVENQYFYYLVTQTLLIFLFLLLGWLILDITKIRIIDSKIQGVGHSLKEAVRLFSIVPVKLYLHYLLIFFIWIIFVVLYWLIQQQLSDRSITGILFEFLLLQAVVWAQIWIRFSRYNLLMHLIQRAN